MYRVPCSRVDPTGEELMARGVIPGVPIVIADVVIVREHGAVCQGHQDPITPGHVNHIQDVFAGMEKSQNEYETNSSMYQHHVKLIVY